MIYKYKGDSWNNRMNRSSSNRLDETKSFDYWEKWVLDMLLPMVDGGKVPDFFK